MRLIQRNWVSLNVAVLAICIFQRIDMVVTFYERLFSNGYIRLEKLLCYELVSENKQGVFGDLSNYFDLHPSTQVMRSSLK